MSCAFDKKIKCWQYQRKKEYTPGCSEKQEQLRCLDYIDGQGKLFVGTNSSVILTIDIAELLAYDNAGDDEPSVKEGHMDATGQDAIGERDDEDDMEGSDYENSPNQSPNPKGKQLDTMAQLEALKKDNQEIIQGK